MNELLIMIGMILLVFSITVAFIYLVLKITAYYKQRFHVSMGPSIVVNCLALDMFTITALLYENGGNKTYVLLFGVLAAALLIYGVGRDIEHYGVMSIGAIGLQFVIALLQLIIFTIAVVSIIIKKIVKRQNTQIKTVMGWLKFIWDL